MIAKMSRLRLAGLKSDYDGVIDLLTECKRFEYRSAPEVSPLPSDEVEAVKVKQAEVSFAISYLYKLNADAAFRIKKHKEDLGYTPYKKEGVRKLISFDSFDKVEDKTAELDDVTEKLKNISLRQVELKGRLAKLNETKKSYLIYKGLPFAFGDRTTELTIATLYFTSKKDVLPSLENAYTPVYPVDGGVIAAVICLKTDYDGVSSEMSKLGFSRVSIKGGTVEELVGAIDDEVKSVEAESEALFKEGLTYEKYLIDLMIYYDLMGIRLDQKNALCNSLTTKYTFILDGWVPEDDGERIVASVEEKFGICASLTPAEKDEDPPTLVINNKLVAPFKNITDMYTVPAYTEKDPNPHMAFWYFVLFGVMCGDVVYGLMISIACLVMLKVKKFESGTANLIKMFAICGVSSMLWGVAFDSYLGYSIGFGWFVPMDKPMMLLGLSLVLGVLQIAYGYILGVIRCIREKNPLGAIFDMGLMLLVVAAIVLLTANIFTGIFTKGEFDLGGKFLPDSVSRIFNKVGLILLLVAIVGIFLTAGRASKSIAGKLGNGLYGVYGLVNLISDILSYCRLFGLGLAGGAIAYAFNTLMETIFFSGGSVPGYIIGAILSLVLHVFNLAISLLGAYVHNARLQMLEFYGKFLVGDGREFSYVGQNTRYVRY